MEALVAPKAYFRDSVVPFEDANISVASAPVLYGLSIYTVFPVFWDGSELHIFRLRDHFRRLQNSCKIMAFDDFLKDWTYPKFETEMKNLLLQNNTKQDSLVRVSVFVDEVLKGTRMQGLKHSLSAFVYPAAPLLPAKGANLCVSSWRRTPDNAIPSRAKINGSYVNAALMKHEAILNGFDDAIALDEQGHVAESTVSNLFLVRDSTLITPSSSADLLEGITRDTVFKLAASLGMEVEQRAIDRSEVYLADEILLCGSSMNITPVLSVDHRPIGDGAIGPVTRKLMQAYRDCGLGKGSYSDWSLKLKDS